MVTTIRITCDGVFIQSNANNSTSPSTTNTTLTTVEDTKSSAISKEKSLQGVEKIAEKSTRLRYSKSRKGTGSAHASTNSVTSEISKIPNRNCSITDNGILCQIKSDSRKRYYFGSSNIYWCKQILNETGQTNHLSTKSPRSVVHKQGRITRSASSCTHNNNAICQQRLFNVKRNSQFNLNNANKSVNSKVSKDLFLCCDKNSKTDCKSELAANKTTRGYSEQKSRASSEIIVQPENLIRSNWSSSSAKFRSDTRLFSFLRSARHLYRTQHDIETKPCVEPLPMDKIDRKSGAVTYKLRSTLFATIIDRLPQVKNSTATSNSKSQNDVVNTPNGTSTAHCKNLLG